MNFWLNIQDSLGLIKWEVSPLKLLLSCSCFSFLVCHMSGKMVEHPFISAVGTKHIIFLAGWGQRGLFKDELWGLAFFCYVCIVGKDACS